MASNIAQYVELVNRYIDEGHTDGFPVIPPYSEAIEEMVKASGRPGDEVLGTVPPRYTPLTIETVAINAFMAGCRPEYMPVVVAALEAMLDPGYNWVWPAVTTKGVAPLVIVNGPIRHKIGINCKGNVFGPGFRANATIGRTLRFIIMNVGGAKSQQLEKATFGHAGKYTYVIGEDEEGSPWSPFHVEHGFDQNESTVTVVACEGPKQIHNPNPDAGAEGILLTIADMMSTLTNFSVTGPKEAFIVIGGEHRQTLKEEGWTKEKIKEYLWDHCGRRAGDIKRIGGGYKGDYIWFEKDIDDSEWIRLYQSPNDIHIISAGGDAGRMSVIIDGLVNRKHTQWQIRKIVDQ